MRDVLGPGTILGYCTNVHAGAQWAAIRDNLQQHAVRVKQLVSPAAPMGIGLWLAQPAMLQAMELQNLSALHEFLQQHELIPFTFNGFPYGDFHQPVVKHAVYEPAWDKPERAGYTIALATILSALAKDLGEASISTLPIGWLSSPAASDSLDRAVFNLQMVARALAGLHSSRGVLVHLDLEPEPGCFLQRSIDVVNFFHRLLMDGDEDLVRRHIRVCHDVCHAAVMFEDQREVMERYRAAGIRVGKVQISSAIRADLRNFSARERTEAVAQLRMFSEDRYLHQAMVVEGAHATFFEDLPEALAAFESSDRAGDEWRVHYHVPVDVQSFGHLRTTQNEIIECLGAIRPEDEIHHFEVETYGWNVLPPELRVNELAEGIARELAWVRDVVASTMTPPILKSTPGGTRGGTRGGSPGGAGG